MKNPTKEQTKQWNKTYYEKNKERIKYNRWKDRLKDWYRDLKATLKCEECNFNHPAALSFHHKKPEEKVLDVCTMVMRGFAQKKIEDEIAKCRVLCHNCHAILHYEESPIAQLTE